MKYKLYPILAIIILSIASCINNNHLIKDNEYRNKVNQKYQEIKDLFSERDTGLFSVFNLDLSNEEAEALKFLIAFMPLSDIADYDGRFFLDNARLSLKAKNQTNWGKDIPENIFLHYVLPLRVNNENLDSFRIVYFNEIHDRVGDIKEIEEAALEINHWCHEKVTYQPADIRTSAPMATILSSRGRCGEESTFTVAALRAAGIPARQIYTPRWAHSDDNHAWVEVWVNGDWKYLGACEPQPVLDRGWFTEPARRAMLTHTKAFGLYRGDEHTVRKEVNYAEINTLPYYARTKIIVIKVLDAYNNAVENAMVEPLLYNYAEFYPLTEIMTDKEGICRFVTGLGDLLIWANKDDKFAFGKITVALTDTLVLKLGSNNDINDYYEFDLQAPVKHIPFPDTVSQQLIIENAERVKEEDSIRQAYINSWIGNAEIIDLATSLELDTTRVKNIIGRSMGNYREIYRLIETCSPEYHDDLLQLLEIVADKDLRDTKASVLEDHLIKTVKSYKHDDYPTGIYYDYVLNPRISHEIITPWRTAIRDYFNEEESDDFASDPDNIADWIAENIKLSDVMNYYNVPISPEGVLKTGYADELSRDILFIACCRSYGIPARIEHGTNIIQFYNMDIWEDVYFTDNLRKDQQDAQLTFSYTGGLPVPEYYIHFTLARFQNGRYITLDYDYNRKVTEFGNYLSLPPGEYMLVTGNRTDESNILTTIKFFKLSEGEEKTVLIELRDEMSPAVKIGDIDLMHEFTHDNVKKKLIEYADNGLVIIWIDHNREPSKHILNDLPLVKMELDNIGCQIIILSDPSSESASYDPGKILGLPEKTVFGFDKDLGVLKSVYEKESFSSVQLPFVLYSDPYGGIYFISEGYRIGIGEQILKTIYKIH